MYTFGVKINRKFDVVNFYYFLIVRFQMRTLCYLSILIQIKYEKFE